MPLRDIIKYQLRLGRCTEEGKELLCSTIDRTRQTASLSRQVETNVQIEEMGEDVASDSAYSILRNVGKDGVP
jgi:hypothetical protein